MIAFGVLWMYDARPPLKSVTEFKDVLKKGETRIYYVQRDPSTHNSNEVCPP